MQNGNYSFPARVALCEARGLLLITGYGVQNIYSNSNSFTMVNPYRVAMMPFMPLFKVAVCTHQCPKGLS